MTPIISDLEYTCRLGLPLIPVHSVNDGFCGCGDVKCRSAGKHPATPKGVHDGCPMVPHELIGKNVGICLGDGVICIDVDPRNGGLESLAALERKYGKMPLTLTCRTGGMGWHYYYKVSRPVRKKPNAFGKGVDLQSDGSYCVAPPSVHHSSEPYIWTSRVEISNAPEWIFEYLDNKTAPDLIKLNEDFSIYTKDDWASMLSKITIGKGDYETWMKVCFGLHSLGTSWAFDLFHSWSATQPGYISIDDCRKHWNSSGKKTGNVIGPATVIHMAYEAGWQWEPQITVSFTATSEETKGTDLEFPRSKFGKICEWYHTTSAYNHPDFAILSAIFSAVPFVQRNYKPALVDNMALAALMVAPSGNGKGFFLNAPFKLVRKWNNRVCVDMTSSALMTRQLVAEFNSRVLFKDEAISQLMRWSKNDFGAEQFETFMSMTSGAYIQGQSFRGAPRVPSLENYSYSFLGNGTLKGYIQLLNAKNFKESGSLSRFIVAVSHDAANATKVYPPLDTCLPDEYCDFIEFIKKNENITSEVSFSSKDKSIPIARIDPFCSIALGHGVIQADIDFRAKSLAMAKSYDDDFGTDEFFTRASENALRLANVISVVNSHVTPILTTEVLLWAQEFVLRLIERQARVFRENIETNAFDQARNKVLRSIRRGNKTRRDIAKNCNVYRKDFDEAIRVLIDTGLVVNTAEGFVVVGDVGKCR